MAGQPRISASSTVSPPVEWTSTSPAASHSGMLVGEALDPHARLTARSADRARRAAASLWPHRQTTCGRPRAGERLVDRARDVADAPAAAGDEHDLALARAGRAPARVGRRPRDEELGPREAVHAVRRAVAAPAMRRTSAIDSGMGDEVHVDAGRWPSSRAPRGR